MSFEGGENENNKIGATHMKLLIFLTAMTFSLNSLASAEIICATAELGSTALALEAAQTSLNSMIRSRQKVSVSAPAITAQESVRSEILANASVCVTVTPQ